MASDQQIVARILSGDTAAVPELEEKYRGPLVDVAQKHLGMSQHEAEEAVQHLFVGLLADDAAPLRSFGWRCALSTWLFALVPRRDPVPPRRESVTGAALAEETAAKAPAAFTGLTDRHRLLLQLSASDGLSYSEIARLVKGSMGEVTSACYGAKLEFSQALGILPAPRVEAAAPEPEPTEPAVEPAPAVDELQASAAETLAGVVGEPGSVAAAPEPMPIHTGVEVAGSPEVASAPAEEPLMPPAAEPSAAPFAADVTVAFAPPTAHDVESKGNENSGGGDKP